MQLMINGKPRELVEECCLLDFLEKQQVNPQLIAIEYNGDIVKRQHFDEIVLHEGDRLEIVQMVGGGAQ